MQAKIKKTVTCLIAVMLILTSLPISAFAEGGVADKKNSGSGSGGGSVNSAYTWTTSQSGYRFQIIDENFKPVGTTVDLVFSSPTQVTNQNDYYTNSRAAALSTDTSKYTKRTIDQIYSTEDFKGGKYPPVPITFSTVNGKSVAQAQGEAFKEWFLSGAGSIAKPTTSVSTTSSSSSPASKNTSESYNSTTKPNIQDDPKPSNDMAYISDDTMMFSPPYRSSKHAESAAILFGQGYFAQAQKIIAAQDNIMSDGARLRAKMEDITFDVAQAEMINESLSYYKSISNSNAEYVYIASSVIINSLGQGWTPTTELGFAELTTTYGGQSASDETNTDSQLENIPLADASNNEGYALKFLNLKTGNKFLFNLPGTDVNDENKCVTNVMIEKGYSIIVEPIFWFVPAAANSSGLPTSPIYSGYVYGTVGNFIQFSKNQGYKYGTSGGAYGTLLGSLGWRSMFLGEDWVGNGITIKGFSGLTGKKSLSDLYSMLNSKQGVAMHIYTTKGASSLQTTRDFTKGSAAHPAPDPQQLAGDDKKYKIVKYYEQELSDGTIDRNKFITVNNPPKISIDDEISYKLKDWFISTSDSDGNADYESSKSGLSNTRTGTKAETVDLKNGELTLYLLLTKGQEEQAKAGPLTLGESEISKSVTTMDSTITNWGPRTFTFSYPSMSGSDTHTTGVAPNIVSHSCNAVWGDPYYKYIITDSATKDPKLEANGAGGLFTAKMVNNTKSGSANIGGGVNTLNTAEYQTVIWRGQDLPTLASYKEPSSINVKTLLGKYSKEPVGDRGLNGSYTKPLLIQLSVDATSDVTTHSVHSFTGGTWRTAVHTAPAVASHTGTVTVNVFRGTNDKSPGKETTATTLLLTTPFGATTSLHSAGYMVQGVTPIYFYPYVHMTYETTGSKVKNDAYVLSQFYSEVLPNDAAEAAWYNPNGATSLTMSSTQWSLYAKAVNGGQSWNGKNQVLPGGAIYQLGSGSTPTKVALVTWQTIVAEPERSELSVALPANEYTLTKATASQKDFVQQAKTTLESLRVVQWVNGDVNASNAWDDNGQSVKITSGGQSLSALGLSTTTSTEAKYRLEPDGSGDAANEGDIDVIKDTPSQDTFFKVFAAPDGSIYLAKSIGSMAPLTSVNGTNPGSATKILDKDVKWDAVDSSLTDSDAIDLNKRTLIVTNLVKSLERDKGSDTTAAWSTSDGKWYNEAWDGIYVVRKADILDVGFNRPQTRSAVLDAKLCPPNNKGQSGMFDTAFLSQFRLDSKSDSPVAAGKPDNWIGTFEGKDVLLPSMSDMYTSKKFYIPNVNVQDLH